MAGFPGITGIDCYLANQSSCGDGRTEVEGTTEDRIRDDGNLSFFVKVNDVHCDCTVVNRSSKFVWSHSPPFNQMGNSRSCGPATQTHLFPIQRSASSCRARLCPFSAVGIFVPCPTVPDPAVGIFAPCPSVPVFSGRRLRACPAVSVPAPGVLAPFPTFGVPAPSPIISVCRSCGHAVALGFAALWGQLCRRPSSLQSISVHAPGVLAPCPDGLP